MNDKPSAYEAFMDAYLQELIGTPDAEILEGIEADGVIAKHLKLLEAAKAEAGKRRLARAREKMKAVSSVPQTSISVSEARAFLQRAVNDPQMTIAARNLDELSEEDILRLYHQILELKALNKST